AFSAGDRRRKLEKTSMGPACVPKTVDWVLVDGAELVEAEDVVAAEEPEARAGVRVGATKRELWRALTRRIWLSVSMACSMNSSRDVVSIFKDSRARSSSRLIPHWRWYFRAFSFQSTSAL